MWHAVELLRSLLWCRRLWFIQARSYVFVCLMLSMENVCDLLFLPGYFFFYISLSNLDDPGEFFILVFVGGGFSFIYRIV